MSTTYTPGSRLALVGDHCLLLLDVDPDHTFVHDFWDSVREASTVTEVLDLLRQRFGPADLPSFCLTSMDASRSRDLVVRGPLRALVDGELVEGGGRSAWSTRNLRGASSVELGSSTTDAVPRLPIERGVVLADGVSLDMRVTHGAGPASSGPTASSTGSVEPAPLDYESWLRPTPPSVSLALPTPVAPRESAPEATRSWEEPLEVPVEEFSNPRPVKPLEGPGPLSTTVEAVWCPTGHPTAPSVPDCRVCGLPVARQAPRHVARPALGRLYLSTGQSLVLDRDVVMGREPTADREGASRPHLVGLGREERAVSRCHVELRLVEWSVQVVDLGSTNGTFLADELVPLRPGVPHVLEPGTSFRIADVVTVTFDPII